jgi:hypothetical protein
VECGELEGRPAATIKFFIQKIYNSMKKPIGSSWLDDLTRKCQALSCELFRKEEETFREDSDEENVFIPPNDPDTSDSDTDIRSDIEDFRRVSTPTVVTATTSRNTGSSISDSIVKSSVHSDTKMRSQQLANTLVSLYTT